MKRRYTHWTRESAIAAIQALASRLGRSPAYLETVHPDSGCPSQRVLFRLFGKFSEYQRAAGLKPTKLGRPKLTLCRRGVHSMRGRNIAIEFSKSRKNPSRLIKHRRCRACLRARMYGHASTRAERRARRQARIERQRQVREQRSALIQRARQHWSNGDSVTRLRTILEPAGAVA